MIYVITALLIYGLAVLWSASWYIAECKYINPFYLLIKQAIWVIIGLAFMFFFSKLDYKKLRKINFWLILSAVISLVAALLFGPKICGATRWLRFGPVSFQTGEYAKFALVIFLAVYFSNIPEERKYLFRMFFYSSGLFVVFAALLMAQPDFPTVLIMAILTTVILVFAGFKKQYILIFVSTLLICLVFLIILVPLLSGKPSRLENIKVLINPWADTKEVRYQTVQSLIAIGANGLQGAGFNKSLQKYLYIPECDTSGIFAILAEELGIIGVIFLFGLYLLLLFQIIKIARRAETLGRLLCAGFAVSMMSPAFVHIGSATGMLPASGAVLPFMSYSGSNIVFILAGLGIILNISKSTAIAGEMKQSWRLRLNLLFLIFLFCFIIFLARVVYIQTIMKQKYKLNISAFNQHFITKPKIDRIPEIYSDKPERKLYEIIEEEGLYEIHVRDARGREVKKGPDG